MQGCMPRWFSICEDEHGQQEALDKTITGNKWRPASRHAAAMPHTLLVSGSSRQASSLMELTKCIELQQSDAT